MMKKFSDSIENRITPRNNFVFEFCGNVKGKTVLDIGCSFGWYEKMAVENGVRLVVGMEPDEKLFHQAKKEVPQASYVVGSAENIPFSNSFFNKVVMLEVLEHLPSGAEQKTIKEVFRILKLDGEFILSTPNRHPLSCLLDPAWYFGHRHYSLNYIRKLIEKNGFTVEKVFIYGGFWELFRMIPHYFFKWILKKEDPFKKFFGGKIISDKDNPNNYAYLYIRAVKNGT